MLVTKLTEKRKAPVENLMLEAHKLQAQGLTQKEIAAAINRSERTVRNYLSEPPRKRRRPVRPSKLDPYKPFIKSVIDENPGCNGAKVHERICAMGFNGKSSIVREYITKLRKESNRKAVIRFETEPARQAQVDWVEFGWQDLDNRRQKLYAFVMVMGYSRMPFVVFTTRMDSATLLWCHIRAFIWFGGVPKEILYDNMKTAWNFDGENWQPNRQLAKFACHYGYVIKRCRIHRPETKGKVERFNQYLEGNFFVDYEGLSLKLEELNESAAEWISRIKKNRLSQFNESREERFAREQKLLNRIPADGFDVRDEIPAVVNRESCITYRTNKYSVNPCYIGRKLILRPSVTSEQIEITDADGQSIRIVECEKAGSRKVILFDDDRRLINAYWEAGLRKDMPARCARKPERPEVPEVQVRLPSDYDAVLPEAAL